MRKNLLWIGVLSLVLSACTTTDNVQQAPPQAPYNGPVVDIPGVQPQYEPYNPNNSQDYKVNGETYRIVKDPQNFSQIGLASWYGEEANGNTTALGEVFDPNALTAAHPTLPIPSYVRVTNISNGRQLVVRINDRGPYTKGRIIDLSKAAADRLNISNNTKVRIDFINVSPDGTQSGPGTVGTRVIKQSFALAARPDLSSGSSSPLQPVATDERAISDPAPANHGMLATDNGNADSNGMSSNNVGNSSGGFLQAPTQLQNGVLESSAPAAAPVIHQPSPPVAPQPAPIIAAPVVAAPVAAHATSSRGGFMVQVGALSSAERARSYQQTLSKKFSVPGKVDANGAVYRVQLGPFSQRQQAETLKQRLSSEAQVNAFITSAQ